MVLEHTALRAFHSRGASGNVATEDVVFMLHGMGIETGVDLEGVVRAGEFITGVLGRPSMSKVATAMAGGGRKKNHG